MLQRILPWLFSYDSFPMLFGERNSYFDKLILNLLVPKLNSTRKLIIIDLEHRISSSDISNHVFIIQPNDLNSQIMSTINLGKMINGQVELIYITGLGIHLQNYRKSINDSIQINIRCYAFLLSVLKQYNKFVKILIKSSFPSSEINSSMYESITTYYTQNLVHYSFNKNETIFSRTRNEENMTITIPKHVSRISYFPQ